jgi:hypothetical protein
MPAAGEVNELLRLADPAGIAVDEIADLPPQGRNKFMAALIDELAKAEVPAYLGQGNAKSFRLKGQVLEFPSGKGTDVQIYWLLVDAKGQSLGNHQVRRLVDAKAWLAGDPAAMTQLARDSSAGIAKLLPDAREQLALRKEPPVRLDANVNTVVPPMGTGLGRAPAKGAQAAAQDKAKRPQTAQAPTPAAAASVAGPGESLAVALRPIEGAPGDGGESLARAMRQFLGRAAIAVVEENRNPAAIVVGRVAVTDLAAQQQEVRIDWTVLAPDGRRLGTIGQANRIPAGRLDGPWGGIANAVAENAVQGLSDLFDQLSAASAAPPSTAQVPTPK